MSETDCNNYSPFSAYLLVHWRGTFIEALDLESIMTPDSIIHLPSVELETMTVRPRRDCLLLLTAQVISWHSNLADVIC